MLGLLYSGGMDSYIAWHYLKKPKTVYFNLYHRYVSKEWRAASSTIPDTTVVNNFDLGVYEKEDANITGRNFILTYGMMLLGFNDICLVVQKDEMSIPDRSKKFFKRTKNMLSFLSGKSIRVFTPFEHIDKFDIVKWYVGTGGDVKELLKTTGCFSESIGHCGNCPACFRRWTSLVYNGIDPGYVLSEEIMDKYVKKFKAGEYSKERTKKSLQALGVKL